jgi:hypothetical protein
MEARSEELFARPLVGTPQDADAPLIIAKRPACRGKPTSHSSCDYRSHAWPPCCPVMQLNKGVISLTAFWIAIVIAGMALVVFTGWPLYNVYKSRTRGDYAANDAAQAQAYFKDKAKGELAQAAADLAETGRPGTQDAGQPAESDPAAPPPRD